MSSEYNVNVNTDVLRGIEGIVNDAFDRMTTSAKTIGAQSDAVGVAYRGSGTATAMDTYTNLSGAAQALGEALSGLRDDIGLTGEHGHATDQEAQAATARGAGIGVEQGMRHTAV
ncbi:hypothetical protein [Streptomyces sp. CB03238]|uniref:hypothetical protein n=1 Tax=Streptomyces sp. CB03238 TaxID=1907777 RepID=UPI000A0F9C69|nr:hypothetical protein [Streptomyces sp. CB03238]ORT60531.1 hypothetical protein BKD26_09215 [Streptomyces sp. CB03238]